MKRRSLVRHFIGESGISDITPDEEGYDRIDLEIHGGKVSFIVPHDVSDDEVFQSQWLDRFLGCDVDLGDGYVLRLTAAGDCDGVDARIERANNK